MPEGVEHYHYMELRLSGAVAAWTSDAGRR